MTEQEFNALIKRYQQGTASPEERALLDAWFESIDHNQAPLQWNESDEDRQFQKINERRGAEKKRARIIPLYLQKWSRIAATLLLLSSASLVLWDKVLRNETMIATAIPGELNKTILADGTLVWLKGNSTLQYPERFDTNERIVYLKGEALFEVAKDASHPFVIRCGGLNARVLGTSFNIKADDHDIELLVLTGKVELSDAENKNTVVVLPNEKVTYDGQPQNLATPVIEGEKEKVITGTEYNMAFSNTTMAEVLKRIEGKFDRKVTLQESGISPCLITADFTDQSLEATLRMTAQILGFEYEINNRSVVIKGGSCR